MSFDLVLIRGLVREAGHWGPFISMLQQKFQDSKIITLDIPGAGEHFRVKTPVSISGIVTSMRQEWSLKKQNHRSHILIAISLGGMIATEWMKSYPEDFKGAVLMNTSFAGISKIHERLKPQALAYLLKVPFLKGAEKEEHIIKLVANDSNQQQRSLPLWVAINEARPVSLPNTLRQLAAATAFKVGKFTPSVPVLIIGSSQDRMVDVGCSKKIAHQWRCPIELHPTAGHDITTDDPSWVVEKISSFVSGLV